MAMRLLVSICCIVTSSAGGVWSQSQFKKEYDAYVLGKDASSVKTANANIVGASVLTEAKETDMQRWYHDVKAEVQADAKAIMDKALADTSAHGHYPTADCLKLITAAMPPTDWATDNPIYLKIVGDDVLVGAEKKAQDCVNALSGPEKEMAIRVGMQSPLFGYFVTKWQTAYTALVTKDVASVSKLVTGTLEAKAPGAPKLGKDTQPMYSTADATLRGEMMIAMVNQLKAELP